MLLKNSNFLKNSGALILWKVKCPTSNRNKRAWEKKCWSEETNTIKMLQVENCVLLSWSVWENSIELFVQFTLARAFRVHMKNNIHVLSWTHPQWPVMMNSNSSIKFVSIYHSQRKPFYISHDIHQKRTHNYFFFMIWDAGASAKTSKNWNFFQRRCITLKSFNSFFSGKAILNNMALKFCTEKQDKM